jgi:hypothetical protein
MMQLERETWTVIHGMVLGALFLLAFAGGLAGLWRLKARRLTAEGIAERPSRLLIGVWGMAVVAWLMVFSGTWILYPWYRARPPEGTVDLVGYPRYFLLDNPELSALHTFAMEWKEHLAWMAPMLATSVAIVTLYYGAQLVRRQELRWPLITTFTLAFAAAGVAGLLGVLITSAAPV